MIKHTEGFIAAPLTGYNPDGSVNLDIISRYASMLHKNGIIGVFVNGTAGEGAYLSFEERLSIAERWVDSVPEGFRVIIHVGYAEQAESKALAAHAVEIGADSIGEIGPDFLKIKGVKALVEYVATTANFSPEVPYYYYHMPSINNLGIPMIDFLALAKESIPSLAGIKYTHDDLPDYKRCIEFMDGKYDILFGRDEFLLDGLRAGASGAVGSTYNIMVGLYHELVNVYRAGDLETAQRLQTISADTCRLLHNTGAFGSGLKTIMRMIGFDLGGMRHPQLNLSPKSVMDLKLSLEQSGMINFLNKT